MLVTRDNFEWCANRVARSNDLVIDVETTGLEVYSGDRIIGIAIGTPEEEFYFPFRHISAFDPEYNNLNRAHKMLLVDRIKEARQNEGYRETGFNYKFDMQFLHQDGLPLPVQMEDPILFAHLCNENEPSFKLETLSARYVDPNAGSAEEELLAALAAIGFKTKSAKAEMWRLPPETVAPYACQDVILTRKLREFMQERLRFWKIEDLARELCEYSMVLTRLEIRGVQLNRELVALQLEEAEHKIHETRERMAMMVGDPNVNLNSAPQMQRHTGLKSTAADYMAKAKLTGKLAPKQLAIIETLQEFRSWDKMRGSYYEPYMRTMDKDGVIHPNFNLTVVVTGRLSMSKPSPNLMAIPRHDEDPASGKVKNVFVARPGMVLINADLSQAELRAIAHYARERRMAGWLTEGRDVHGETRDLLYGLGLTGFTRDDAKRINFGIAYGLGIRGFAEGTGLPRPEAARVLNMYHDQFPGFRRLMNKAETSAEKNGFIRLFTGRYRRYNTVFSDPHKAMSNLIQGAVAELIRLIMTRLDPMLAPLGAYQVLQVHDSVMVECPDDDGTILEVFRILKEVMEDSPFEVPMVADAEIGYSWGSAVKVKTKEELESWLSSRSLERNMAQQETQTRQLTLG